MFNKEKKKTETVDFLRLNITDKYNNGMGQVDIADQLRNSYRFDHWLRNNKWWHSVYWWGMQVMLINLYIIYKKVCERAGVKPLTHYAYQRDVALAWINPEKYGLGTSYKTPSDHDSTESGTLSTMSRSSAAGTTTSSGNKMPYLNSSSLDPKKGSLRDRLEGVHWPDPSPRSKHKKSPPCQLCRWASNRKARKHTNTAYCQECNVVLCLGDCWQKFHSVWDLVDEKDSIRISCCENIQPSSGKCEHQFK